MRTPRIYRSLISEYSLSEYSLTDGYEQITEYRFVQKFRNCGVHPCHRKCVVRSLVVAVTDESLMWCATLVVAVTDGKTYGRASGQESVAEQPRRNIRALFVKVKK